ncbi:MAG TPA: hypothetical protein VF950_16340 [Planctomycetota bacterium]
MSWKAAALFALCLLCAAPAEVAHLHPSRGRVVPVSLERVRKARKDVAARFAEAADRAAAFRADRPFESGLPACAARRTRRVRTEVPPALVGRSISFAPEGRFAAADVRVATSARSLGALEADALADRALAERLDVRCRPTLVRMISEVELELVEMP